MIGMLLFIIGLIFVNPDQQLHLLELPAFAVFGILEHILEVDDDDD